MRGWPDPRCCASCTRKIGGAFLNMGTSPPRFQPGAPAALEETFEEVVLQALETRTW